MKNDLFLTVGRIFFGTAVLVIGIIHLITGNFPTGLLPSPASFTGKIVLVYIAGISLIIAGALIVVKKYAHRGAFVAGVIFLIFLLALHIPRLIMYIDAPNEWTGTLEILSFFSGALILLGTILKAERILKHSGNTSQKSFLTGSYIFAICLFGFGVLHVKYEQFIITLIPAWLPLLVFWSYVVMVGFFAVFVSIVIQKWVHLSTLLLGLMFFIWVLILHLPRVAPHVNSETEWTSLFVALMMSGTSLLIAGSTSHKYTK